MTLRFNNEAKTGLFVVICVLAILALIAKVQNFSFFEKGYSIKTRLHFLDGVKVHAPVRLSGVDVGEVKNIEILYGDDTEVELDLWLRDGVRVRKDSMALVSTLGLMGEKFIEIKNGTSGAGYAEPNDLIRAKDPVRLDEIFEMVKNIGSDVGQMARDIDKVAQHVDKAIVDNRPKLDRIFDNLEETSGNFREFSQDIKFHPWKILIKGREKSREEMEALRKTSAGTPASEEPVLEKGKSKTNFGPKN